MNERINPETGSSKISLREGEFSLNSSSIFLFYCFYDEFIIP